MIRYQEWVISFECESEKFPQLQSIIESNLGKIDRYLDDVIKEGELTRVNLHDEGIYTHNLYGLLANVKKTLVKEDVRGLSIKHSFPSKLEEVI